MAYIGESPAVTEFEIASAAARTGLRLNELQFHISNKVESRNLTQCQISNWKNFTSSLVTDLDKNDGSFFVSVGCVVSALQTIARKQVKKDSIDGSHLVGCLVAVLILIPFFSLDFNGASTYLWLYLFFSSVILWMFGNIVFQ